MKISNDALLIIIRDYIDALLKKNGVSILSDDLLIAAINALSQTPLFEGVDINFLRDTVADEYSSYFTEDAKILRGNPEQKPWLNEVTGKCYHREINWNYWDDYKYHLGQKGFSKEIINGIDKHTNLILSSLDDPLREGSWDRRGMIVGEVQSGKTANYSGVVCKAADAGYGVIIILAGMYNDLRSQTQARLDESFIGFDTSKTDLSVDAKSYRIGVGRRHPRRKGGVVLWHTTTEDDFNRKIAKSAGTPVEAQDPIILVVKKNKSVMDNLNFWIKRNIYENNDQIMDTSLLLIDDECDNASINTRKYESDDKEYDLTAINKGIRRLLRQFSKSAYIGYTATPYANVLINRDAPHKEYGEDLFPRDFIINLPAPDNHIGPSTIFGILGDKDINVDEREGYPLIENVKDQDILLPNIKKLKTGTIVPKTLSPSLREAFYVFVLSCATRMHRGFKDYHNTFLVHASSYVNIHIQLCTHLDQLREEVYNHIIIADDQKYWDRFKDIWENKFIPVSNYMNSINMGKNNSWGEIKVFIPTVLERMVVVMVNGQSKDGLEYQKYADENIFKNYIAVGGNRLSRGLTLEGLLVSYFLRSSTMYDTLMQMGRWFGYRNGYLDLCRLYTTREIVDAYKHIALATVELKQEFDQLLTEGKKPKDYGLKVRSHPGTLMVTGYGKRRWGHKIRFNFTSRLLQIRNILIDEKNSFSNYQCVTKLIKENMFKINESKTAYISNNVNSQAIIEFVGNYQVREFGLWQPQIISDFIKKRNEDGELISWTVAILNSQRKEIHEKLNSSKAPTKEINGLGKLNLTMRNGEIEGDIVKISKSYVSPYHEWIDYSQENVKKIEEKEGEEMKAVFARKYRKKEEGLLLIYPLFGSHNIKTESNINYGLNFDHVIFTPAISFSGQGEDKEYVVDSKVVEQLELEFI